LGIDGWPAAFRRFRLPDRKKTFSASYLSLANSITWGMNAHAAFIWRTNEHRLPGKEHGLLKQN
jgi:hypothetical protein